MDTLGLAPPPILARRRDSARASARNSARDLEQALSRTVEGEVRFDGASRAAYATDLSIYRQVPIGVVIPRHAADVEAAVAACRARDAPILGRGCGTSLAGQACNVAVVLDFSKYMNRILELDPAAQRATVEPGVINDQLRAAARRHDLTFAPDPATHTYCTVGGNIGNNSCGVHTVMGGKTVDNVEALDVLTYDGLRLTVGATDDRTFAAILAAGGRRAEIYARLKDLARRSAAEIARRYPNIPRRVSGYNLDDLLPEKGVHVARALVGSESTCALTLSATVRLLPWPARQALLLLGYPDLATAADDVPELRAFGPDGLEAFDAHTVENMQRKGKALPGARLLPDGRAWLLVEFGGADQAEANGKAERAYARLQRSHSRSQGMRVVEAADDQAAVWHIRESGVGASRVPEQEEAWPSWEDAAVPPERLGDYLRDFAALNQRFGYRATIFGHFGDGCVHARMTFDLKSRDGVRRFRDYMEAASDLCLRYGGSLSGEHGDGQAKGELLVKMFGPDLVQAFREFKSIWDPHWRMNPGKLIDARPLDHDLRLGPDHAPPAVATQFRYPEDRGSFAHAVERCFGVGLCRRPDGQTMCPSFQATREEVHSTRGRAHLLFEMLRGDPLKGGWRDEGVRAALDLCLQCKGCKHDCPVSVDMATYKAEFLSHYYKGRLRPPAAYAMGLVMWWAPLAMAEPGLANLLLKAPPLRRLAGFAPDRPPPAFAAQSFQSWHRRRPQRGAGRPVILWPDTFTNYFQPGAGKAAVAVLEDAGYAVTVPRARLCCGRPLYDYGMLDLARRQLRRVLDVLRPAIRAGIPVVGLEPSCVAVFRDELQNLMPADEDARRLGQQTRLLSELLAADDGWSPPRFPVRALLHTHCHHKAVLDGDSDDRLLRRMGAELLPNPAGCCGQAGSFGYEAGRAAVAKTIGEQGLLPAARRAGPAAVLVAGGFSCREQLRFGTGRTALHPAQLVATALAGHSTEPVPALERRWRDPPATPRKAILAGIGAAAALAVVLALRTRRPKRPGREA